MGMGTLAELMLAKGCKVSGSDVKENQVTAHLRDRGAVIRIGHTARNIGCPDRVIYSSAVGPDNPEIQAARRKNIPVEKRAQLLSELVNAQTGITVAGAHGKTTTTAMIARLLLKAGCDPTTMVGGWVKDSSDHAHLGSGKYFVAELDESDGSFLFFKPALSVVTNIDYEHLDHYGNWKNILKAYTRFIRRTKKGGCVFACGDCERLRKLLAREKTDVLTYGTGPRNDLRAGRISFNGYALSFDCFWKRKKMGTIQLRVPGGHNVLNALACVAVGRKLGIDFTVIRESLQEFPGVERRFQKKAEINDILVVDDYGHHPTEIVSTLKTARSFGKKRVITIFQPHRYSRTKYLWNKFLACFGLSDYLIITDIYAAGEKPILGVTGEGLRQKIKNKKKPAVYLKKKDIVPHLLEMVRPGDLVLFLGAGDITQVGEDFVERIGRNFL